jgi:GDPmannose 4,6-dehydratase
MAFRHAGLDFQKHVQFDPRYLRPAEVDLLLGDPTKAEKKLGWKPETSVEQLAAMMVDHDTELASREKTLRDAGHAMPAFAGHDQ